RMPRKSVALRKFEGSSCRLRAGGHPASSRCHLPVQPASTAARGLSPLQPGPASKHTPILHSYLLILPERRCAHKAGVYVRLQIGYDWSKGQIWCKGRDSTSTHLGEICKALHLLFHLRVYRLEVVFSCCDRTGERSFHGPADI